MPLPLGETPAYSCLVLVLPLESGRFRARTANYDGLVCEAGSERAALMELAKQFEQRLAAHADAGEPIPWLEPPLPAEDGEYERAIPVHL